MTQLKQILAPIAAQMLRYIPTHYYRKRFAKLVGPFFEGAVAKTAFGFPMIARWHDNANRIAFEGSYGIVADFILAMPANSLYIDIGANQGATCILAARRMSAKGGGVLAFEPSPLAFERMQENIALNQVDNIYSHQRAVAPTNKELLIDTSDRQNSGAAHVTEHISGESVLAQPICLSDIRRLGNYNDIFIKIDTEGYELEVLKGVEELLSANLVRSLVIEIDETNLSRFGASAVLVYDYLAKYGFTPKLGLSTGHYDEVFIAKQ